MDKDKPVGPDVPGWVVGFLIGLIGPALCAVLFSLLWFKKPGDHLFNFRAGFFACLICAIAELWLGRRGWHRSAAARGLAYAGSLWLVALPFTAGDCVS